MNTMSYILTSTSCEHIICRAADATPWPSTRRFPPREALLLNPFVIKGDVPLCKLPFLATTPNNDSDRHAWCYRKNSFNIATTRARCTATTLEAPTTASTAPQLQLHAPHERRHCKGMLSRNSEDSHPESLNMAPAMRGAFGALESKTAVRPAAPHNTEWASILLVVKTVCFGIELLVGATFEHKAAAEPTL